MTAEDRLRATTQAVSAAMRPIRPLDLHTGADLLEVPAKPHRPRQSRQSRRWSGWLVPITAAAAVIVVAATLVMVRGSSGTGSASRPTPAAAASSSTGASDSVPPYYVTLNSVKGTATWDAVLGDTATGKALAAFKPPSYGSWSVANSASDNTFVLYAGPTVTQIGAVTMNKPSSVAFYLLRVSPGAPQQAQPTRIPITLTDTNIFGAAVSPDGQTLAVLFQPVVKSVPGKTSSEPLRETLRTYSLATGKVLRAWTGTALDVAGQSRLTWLDDDHTLGLTSLAITGAVTWDIRTLNTTSPGTSLTADSTVVFHTLANTGCAAPVLTLDGKSVICGINASNPKQCSTGQPALTSYSVATGKLEHVLYRYQASCQFGSAVPLWAPSGSSVIGMVQGVVTHVVNHYSHSKITTDLGVMTPATFTPLPITQTEATNGTVAFAAF